MNPYIHKFMTRDEVQPRVLGEPADVDAVLLSIRYEKSGQSEKGNIIPSFKKGEKPKPWELSVSLTSVISKFH